MASLMNYYLMKTYNSSLKLTRKFMSENKIKKTINIKIDSFSIEGELTIPENAHGVVLFAHGSGSSRFSPRNVFVAEVLQNNNLATLLIDLLSKVEDLDYERRFDIDLLAERLIKITDWLKENEESKSFKIGYFGASTGAAAAIKAAVVRKNEISAIVSRGGRVDLAESELSRIESPILFIVGENDDFVLELNEIAYKKTNCEKELSIIPDATHLFEEPGALEEVAAQATKWFSKYLKET